MSQLFFKKPLQDAIRSGRKRTTIRRWNRPMLQAGRRAYSPGLGWLSIHSVELIDLGALSDADAQADGFEAIGALRAVLVEFYPEHETDGKQWFRVFFEWEPCRKEF